MFVSVGVFGGGGVADPNQPQNATANGTSTHSSHDYFPIRLVARPMARIKQVIVGVAAVLIVIVIRRISPGRRCM